MPVKFAKAVLVDYKPEDLPAEPRARLGQLCTKVVDVSSGEGRLETELTDTDCLLLRLGGSADRALLGQATQLKYIGMLGTGYGRIDTAYAASRGITVCNIAGYSTEGVAEFAFAVILEFLRELERAKRQAAAGDYSEASFTGSDLKGKSFGIIGLGRIGSRVAQIAQQGFQADVRYWSRNRKRASERDGIRYQELDDLLSECEILSLHLEYNRQTERFLDASRIALINPGAVLVNLSAMELVEIPALEARLANKELTAIIDHSDELSEAEVQSLSKHGNCILYPPIAYTTTESTIAKHKMFIDNLENYLVGHPSNKVN
jgi:phosphoglycerate dehydrogenase-like enzyme